VLRKVFKEAVDGYPAIFEKLKKRPFASLRVTIIASIIRKRVEGITVARHAELPHCHYERSEESRLFFTPDIHQILFPK
jgi:hypothetical protein